MMPAVLSTAIVRKALELEKKLMYYVEQRGKDDQENGFWVDRQQDQQEQQYQQYQGDDLTAPIKVLLKFLQHTGQNKLLHGPSFGRGVQLGYTATKRDGREWTVKEDGQYVEYDEMPQELMELIEDFLQKHDVWEVPAVPG